METLPHITVETGEQPNATVIWLHGLGANGHDFEGVVPHLNLPDSLPVRFIFPHAPEIPVTINGGYRMPAWYDILELGLERKIDYNQIEQSSQRIVDLIEHEITRGIDSRRIVIAGFSQGGAVAYHCALNDPRPLAGILALSTYFATAKEVQVHKANESIPVHLFHGSLDDMVHESMGRAAHEALIAKGLEPSYRSYPMGHEVCMEEISDISHTLQALLRE